MHWTSFCVLQTTILLLSRELVWSANSIDTILLYTVRNYWVRVRIPDAIMHFTKLWFEFHPREINYKSLTLYLDYWSEIFGRYLPHCIVYVNKLAWCYASGWVCNAQKGLEYWLFRGLESVHDYNGSVPDFLIFFNFFLLSLWVGLVFLTLCL